MQLKSLIELSDYINGHDFKKYELSSNTMPGVFIFDQISILYYGIYGGIILSCSNGSCCSLLNISNIEIDEEFISGNLISFRSGKNSINIIAA